MLLLNCMHPLGRGDVRVREQLRRSYSVTYEMKICINHKLRWGIGRIFVSIDTSVTTSPTGI